MTIRTQKEGKRYRLEYPLEYSGLDYFFITGHWITHWNEIAFMKGGVGRSVSSVVAGFLHAFLSTLCQMLLVVLVVPETPPCGRMSG
jgi:hypothetical protein